MESTMFARGLQLSLVTHGRLGEGSREAIASNCMLCSPALPRDSSASADVGCS